jgi:glycosyltransferase involved in cell wall biosynthesis
MNEALSKSISKPKLCFVGPMVGARPGFVTTQGVVLSKLLREAGYPVMAVSEKPNRYARLLDIISTVSKRRKQIDVMIIEVYSGPSFFIADTASRLGKLLGHRVILWLHGGALPDFITRHPAWTRSVFSRADLLVSPSRFLSRAVSAHGFESLIIPNVLDLSGYAFRLRRVLQPRLFWMRSFHPIWNPAMAIHVLARLQMLYPQASLVMAGKDKGLEQEIIRLAERLNLSGSVRFAGFLGAEEKKREGAEADIYLNTNHVDNMPVAVLEACAMGMPVVTTAVGGIPDLLTDGETGLLVPDDDVDGMVNAITSLIQSPEMAERLSINGRQLAEKSSWEFIRPQWEKVFAA